jgi:hypothetical protein
MFYRKSGDRRNAIPPFLQGPEGVHQSEAKRAYDTHPHYSDTRMVRWIVDRENSRHYSEKEGMLNSICFHKEKPLLITP